MTELNLNTIVSITELLMVIIFMILTVFIFKAINKFMTLVTRIEKEVMRISEEIIPILNEVDYISQELKILTEKTKLKYAKAEIAADTLIEKSFGLINLINKFKRNGIGHFKYSMNLLSAISTGIIAFRKKI